MYVSQLRGGGGGGTHQERERNPKREKFVRDSSPEDVTDFFFSLILTGSILSEVSVTWSLYDVE